MYRHTLLLLSFFAAGLGALMLVISSHVFRLNRKKGLALLLISVLYSAVAGYYIYLAAFMNVPMSIFERELYRIERQELSELQ